MSAQAFVEELRVLHEKAKKGTLAPVDRARYEAAREQLARMVMVSQQMGAGKTLRSTFRMAKMVKVELKPDDGESVRASTIDLASGGFAALMPTSGKVGKTYAFTLNLPGSPISGEVVIASSRPHGGLFRISFTFSKLEPAAKEQLNIILIDAVLERFAAR